MANSAHAQRRSVQPLAIVDVTVVPMESERTAENQTVVIEDGRIAAVGPTAQVDVTNMQVVDGTGRFLMPGLADMHVHYWDESESAMYLANGVTVVRNMWGSPLHMAMEAKVRSGESAGPRIITTSPLIDGLNDNGRTLWPGSNFVDEPKRADRFVRRYADQGFKQIKVYSLLDSALLASLGRAAKENGVTLVGHCPNPMTFEEAISDGMVCFEHLTNVFFGHLQEGVHLPTVRTWDESEQFQLYRAVVEGTDLDAIRRLAATMADRRIWNCPTTTVWQGGLKGAAALADPRMDYMPSSLAGWWTGRGVDGDSADLARLKELAVNKRIEVLSILREEGTPVLVGTDTPNPFCFQGFSLHDEIDNFLAAGFGPYAALRAATVDAAEFVDESDEWGTITQGKRADLVLVNGDPLKDVRVLRDPEAVFTNGFYLARHDLADLLAQRSRKVKQVPEISEVHLDHSHGSRHLTERASGIPVAKVCCNTMPQPDGALVIDEERSDGDGLRTRRRIFLGPDRKLERADQTVKSRAGEEGFTVERTDGGYHATVKSLDGFVIESEVRSPALYPSDIFGFAPLSEALNDMSGLEDVATLSIDHEELVIVPATIEKNESEEVVVTLNRQGTPSELTFGLDPQGSVVKMNSISWGPREMTADD